MRSNSPYYALPERQARLVEEVTAWLGTPFRENCAVRGRAGGVDCVRFVAAVHSACGVEGIESLPVLPVEFVRGWHEHYTESRLGAFFAQPSVRERLRTVDADDPLLVGDMLAMRVGKTEHHLVLYVGGESVAHAVSPAGVVVDSLRDRDLRERVRSRWRIMDAPPGA